MILCQSPLRQLVPKYSDKYILVCGMGDLINVSQEYGFTRAIHIDEYFSLHPELSPLVEKTFPKERMSRAKEQVIRRLGSDIGERDINFEAIMMMGDVDYFELSLAIISDLLLSKQGSIMQRRGPSDKQFVKLYITNPDLVYASNFKFSRTSGQQPLILALRAFMQQAHGMDVEVT